MQMIQKCHICEKQIFLYMEATTWYFLLENIQSYMKFTRAPEQIIR